MPTEEAELRMLLNDVKLSVQALWSERPQRVICQGQFAVTLPQVISQLETHQVSVGGCH